MRSLARREFLAGSGALLGWLACQGLPTLAAAQPSEASRARRQGFSFLHTYEATGRYWQALEKAGLLRPTNGVRFVHSSYAAEAKRFNAVARVGGPLYQILEQRRCPFIVDRVAGGILHHVYDFDADLVRRYEALLGEKLLGGQIHEVISNTHNDWDRWKLHRATVTQQPITEEEIQDYLTGKKPPFTPLEYGTFRDYVGRQCPTDAAQWAREMDANALRQAARFAKIWSYCEGTGYGELVWSHFYRLGARSCLVEVGPWASSQSQLAIASARGAAKAAGRPWGIFHAPWGPAGCTAYTPEEDWAWQCTRREIEGDYPAWKIGPEGGPSSALHRRMFFHAYLSGAHTLHEEWGSECNLLDWETAKLTPYGQVTRELLDFQERCPDVGEPYTPLALLVDPQLFPPRPEPWNALKALLFQYGEADQRCAGQPQAGQKEVACYAPCAIPELFDVVPADAPPQVLQQYSVRIPVDTTLPGASADAASTWERLRQAAAEHSPCTRQTHLIMQLNRRQSDGAWIVGLYNPWGAVRGDVMGTGSVLNEACTIQDTLTWKTGLAGAKILYAWPTPSTLKVSGNTLAVTLGPGGALILEVSPAKA